SPFDFDTTGYGENTYTFNVHAGDAAGNWQNKTYSFKVDNTRPTITLNGPANGAFILAGTTLDFDVFDANSMSVVFSTGGAYSVMSSPWDISTTGMPDGALTVTINATDIAGNFRNNTYSFTI